MSFIETVLPVLETAQNDLKKTLVELIQAGSPSVLIINVGTALAALEHSPCLLEEKCTHEKSMRPEIQTAYEVSRQLFREKILIPLCHQGATAAELTQAIKALYALELHEGREDEDEDDGEGTDEDADEDDYEDEDEVRAEIAGNIYANLAFNPKRLATVIPLETLKEALALVREQRRREGGINS